MSHVQRDFGSSLKYIEETFGLGSLNTTDARADDLSDMVDYTQTPLTFNVISARAVPVSDEADTRIPDDQ